MAYCCNLACQGGRTLRERRKGDRAAWRVIVPELSDIERNLRRVHERDRATDFGRTGEIAGMINGMTVDEFNAQVRRRSSCVAKLHGYIPIRRGRH